MLRGTTNDSCVDLQMSVYATKRNLLRYKHNVKIIYSLSHFANTNAIASVDGANSVDSGIILDSFNFVTPPR